MSNKKKKTIYTKGAGLPRPRAFRTSGPSGFFQSLQGSRWTSEFFAGTVRTNLEKLNQERWHCMCAMP
jgi:hypothetical protein